MNQTATLHPAAQRLARIIASLFGLGYVPFASGTLASAVGVLTGMVVMRGGQAAMPEAVLAVIVLGLMTTELSGAATSDPSWIVIDELAGMWMALTTLLHPSARGLIVAFVLFRLLDITKLGPVGWADRRHNAAGIMGDDLIAGAITACVIWGVQVGFPGLLS